MADRCEATTMLRDDRWGGFKERCDLPAGHGSAHATIRSACTPEAWLVWTDNGQRPGLCGPDCATEREMAYARGRDEERAAVVEWLRTGGLFFDPSPRRAKAIEQGEHRRG